MIDAASEIGCVFPCRTQLLLLSETMIIKASKYCYAIKDIEPKGRIHVQSGTASGRPSTLSGRSTSRS